jgi:hypothetical protein
MAFLTSQWQFTCEVAESNLKKVSWEEYKAQGAEWLAAWGETPTDHPSGETDVGGFPISGMFTNSKGQVVGSYGPTAKECWMAFPDGKVVQWSC